MEHYTMNLTLKVWRQKNKKDKGSFETYAVSDISSEMSFLEMFDVLNERLVVEGREPIAFDHDCREGICGMCSMYINGRPHGPWEGTTTCQLHMRAFKDGDTIVVEPWRANAFPVVKDLVVDRSAFDRIIQAGGYISVNTGNAVGDRHDRADVAGFRDAFEALDPLFDQIADLGCLDSHVLSYYEIFKQPARTRCGPAANAPSHR